MMHANTAEYPLPYNRKSYNQFMGGTDKNDQLTRLQRCRRHYRWPRRLTMKFMMWAIFNSYIIHGTLAPHVMQGKRTLTFHMYIEILCGQLIGDVRRGAQILPGRVTQESRLLNAPEAPIHLAEHPDNASRNNRCVVCLERHRRAKRHNPESPDLPKQRKTVFKCSACNVFLCIGSGDKNCFNAYHSKVQYWR